MKPIARFIVVAGVFGYRRSFVVVDTSNDTQVRCVDRQLAETYAALRNAQEGTSRWLWNSLLITMRARQIRVDWAARRRELDEAIDQLQSAVLETGAVVKLPSGASYRVGRARKHLIAVVERNDRAERMAA